jgi:hydrogenase/urease accessory protein HupE
VAYASIDISGEGVSVALSLNLFELDLLLGLDRDADARVDQREIQLAEGRIAEYLSKRVIVSADGKPLPMTPGTFRVTHGSDGKDLFEATLRFPAGHPMTYTIRCEPLTDLGPDHRTLAKISDHTRTTQFIFQKDVTYQSTAQTFSEALGQFLKLGVVHIFTGYDHVLFLLGLLLAATTALDAVKIVTAFTIAHSVTLALAALGIVTPPARAIEAGIALSIVYVALENLVLTDRSWRWVVSFCFGLVHGFGFASVLREMGLERSSMVSSLLSFNIGVELGQLAIVVLLLPLLKLLRRSRAFPVLVQLASGLILAQGLWWLYERALT